jgi:hypothetical protein
LALSVNDVLRLRRQRWKRHRSGDWSKKRNGCRRLQRWLCGGDSERISRQRLREVECGKMRWRWRRGLWRLQIRERSGQEESPLKDNLGMWKERRQRGIGHFP